MGVFMAPSLLGVLMNIEIKKGDTHSHLLIYNERSGIGRIFKNTDQAAMQDYLHRQLDRLYDKVKLPTKEVNHESN